MNLPTLHADGVTLRPFHREDFADAHRFLSDPEVMRFSLAGPYSEEQTRAFLERCLSSYETHGFGLFAVGVPDFEGVIGYCGFLRQTLDGKPEIEIGYRLHRAVWGRGIATRAAVLVRDHGFAVQRFPHVISMIEPANVASARVAQKVGMRRWRQVLYADRIPVDIYRIDHPEAGGDLAPAAPLP